MTEKEWMASADPRKMLIYVRGKAVATKRKLQLFACACCRRVWNHIPAGLPREAVERSERRADGLASERDEQIGEAIYNLYFGKNTRTSELSPGLKRKTSYSIGDWGVHASYWCQENTPTNIIDYVLDVPSV